jgi:hypothetical protein
MSLSTSNSNKPKEAKMTEHRQTKCPVRFQAVFVCACVSADQEL